VLGVHGKLVKYVVHSFKRKGKKNLKISSYKLSKQQSTNFWSQGILGVNKTFSKVELILRFLEDGSTILIRVTNLTITLSLGVE
jgi:hypothetical protein